MNSRLALLAVLGGAMSAASAAQDKGASAAPADPAALLQSCDNHKFETTVVAAVGGKPRSQKVKICGVASQTDADWKRTLEDAIEKVQANEKMEPVVKEQITAALKLEIGRLETGVAVPAAGGSSLVSIPGLSDLGNSAVAGAPPAPARPAIPAPARPLEQDYTSLKPLPAPLRPATPAPPRPLEQDYANLQPLPAPLPPAAVSAAAASVRPARPALVLGCSTLRDLRSAECLDVEPGTVFTVRADENLDAGIGLRFLRKGDPRGDVTLAAMERGQTVRVPLPQGVCRGVTRGRVEVQVLRQPKGSGLPQVVDSYGPYELRC